MGWGKGQVNVEGNGMERGKKGEGSWDGENGMGRGEEAGGGCAGVQDGGKGRISGTKSICTRNNRGMTLGILQPHSAGMATEAATQELATAPGNTAGREEMPKSASAHLCVMGHTTAHSAVS